MAKTLFKVYCAGKWYTCLTETKARYLFNVMMYQNKHTKIIKIENKKEILIDEFI